MCLFYLRKDSCIYIAGKFQCRKTSWDVQNDDEHYGKNSRKSTGEENRSNSEEEDMLDMMLHGGERVKIQNLQGVISWYNGKR